MLQTDQGDLMPVVSPLKLILTALYILVWPALILFLSGDWHWRQGWIFCGWFLFVCVSAIGWLYRHNPALLAERDRNRGPSLPQVAAGSTANGSSQSSGWRATGLSNVYGQPEPAGGWRLAARLEGLR